jgi:hypothetical protein
MPTIRSQMTMMSPEKLRAQSVHVLWSLRQLLELA